MTRYDLAVFSAQIASPTKNFGQPARLPLKSTEATGHVRVTIPADIPDTAILLKADLVFTVLDAFAGARTMTALRHATQLVSKTLVWNNRPATTGTPRTDTLTDAVAGDTWVVDVLDDVQDIVAGTLENYGWQVYTGNGTSYVAGSRAAYDVPYLDLTWAVPGEPPTDLSPSGRIATGNPTLTFLVAEGTTHVQVQVSSTENFSAIVYDSGQTAATAGVFPLTGYTIPDGDTRFWRVRAWSSGVPSDWSGVAETVRDDLGALAITDPGATTGDPLAPVTWTFAGQEAWRAYLYEHARAIVVADSGLIVGTEHTWTPPTGIHGEGMATWHVEAYDDKADRVPTPGVDVFAAAAQTFTVEVGGTDDGPTGLTATQRGGTPIIDLEWTWTAPLPDGWKAQIVRTEGGGSPVWLDRVAGTVTQYADRTAGRFRNYVYKVLPVNPAGAVSASGVSDLIFPTSSGIWLLDPDADYADVAGAVILGEEQGTQEMEEQAIVHQVNNRAPVRRRLGIVPPYGEQGGPIMDALGYLAADSYAQLMAWKPKDAGTVYRMVMGTRNFPVTLGNIELFETPDTGNNGDLYAASFSWWHTDDELPWGVA